MTIGPNATIKPIIRRLEIIKKIKPAFLTAVNRRSNENWRIRILAERFSFIAVLESTAVTLPPVGWIV